MNLLYEVIFEKEMNGKKFRMNVASGSTYQECHDFCVEVMKKVMELAEQDAKRRQEADQSSSAEATADRQKEPAILPEEQPIA